jgi:hypothetical protein
VAYLLLFQEVTSAENILLEVTDADGFDILFSLGEINLSLDARQTTNLLMPKIGEKESSEYSKEKRAELERERLQPE